MPTIFSTGAGKCPGQLHLSSPVSGECCNCLCSLASVRKQDRAMTTCLCLSQQGSRRMPHPSSPVCASRGRMQKMASASISDSRRVSAVPCPSSRCSKISKWISFTYTLGDFQTSAFVLDPEVSDCNKSFQRRISVHYSPLDPLAVSPRGYGGSSLWWRFQVFGCLTSGTPTGLMRSLCSGCHPTQGEVFFGTSMSLCLLYSLPHSPFVMKEQVI